MDPFYKNLLVFLSGLTLLFLFLFYMGTVDKKRKRLMGTLLSVGASLFFIWAYASEGLKKGIDLQGGSTFTVKLEPGTDGDGNQKSVTPDSVNQAMQILEKRLNPDGSKDMLMVPTGKDRIEIQMPGISDEEIKGVKQKIEQVAHLEFRLVHPNSASEMAKVEAGSPVIGFVRLPVKDPKGEGGETHMLVKNRADLDGKYVKQAFATLDPNKGWMIILKFDSEGGKLFGEITGANTGRQLAVVVDNEIISAPNLREAIFGGSA